MLPDQNSGTQLTLPWIKFLNEVDVLLPEPVELHCLGGFVVIALYGFPRPTADIDFLEAIPSNRSELLQEIGGQGSRLAKKYGVYLQPVKGVTNYPEDYESRLVAMYPGHFKCLSLKALEAYDLVLTKLERNSPKDREDVAYLVRQVPLDAEVLRMRYEEELRPYMVDPIAQRLDNTLKLWIDDYFRAF